MFCCWRVVIIAAFFPTVKHMHTHNLATLSRKTHSRRGEEEEEKLFRNLSGSVLRPLDEERKNKREVPLKRISCVCPTNIGIVRGRGLGGDNSGS